MTNLAQFETDLWAAADNLRANSKLTSSDYFMAREIFSRMKTLILEPSIQGFYVRHDNIEAIYKKLEEKRDTADVTEVLKELQRIVNDAIRAQGAGEDQKEAFQVDLSEIDFEKLRDEFASKVRRKHAALQDIRELVEEKLAKMLAQNPARMDYNLKYQTIVAEYNREKDRATVEQTFLKVLRLVTEMDWEAQRHVREELTEGELTFFDLLRKENISKVDRERVKQASKSLLASLQQHLGSMPNWTRNIVTQAEVQMFILDKLITALPRPPFSEEDANALANKVYEFVWQQSDSEFFQEAA